MRALNIVSTAYRATLEEQDDTIIWLTHAMKDAGADLSVLLRGNAVNYAVVDQDASGLAFGADRQTQPPQLAEDLKKLLGKGVKVYVVSEDLAARGISREEIIGGLALLPRAELPKVLGEFDHVWTW